LQLTLIKIYFLLRSCLAKSAEAALQVFLLRRLPNLAGQPVYFKTPVAGKDFDVLGDPTLRIPSLAQLATALVPGAIPDDNPLGRFALPLPPPPPKPAQVLYLEGLTKIMGAAYRGCALLGAVCHTRWYHAECGAQFVPQQYVGSYLQKCTRGHWSPVPIMFGHTDHSPLILHLLRQLYRRMKAVRRQLAGTNSNWSVCIY
jgi:hypothetical protein